MMLTYGTKYQQGMAIDETGEMLASGSTTGGLWTTEEQGDHWQSIDARLPAIHAVGWG